MSSTVYREPGALVVAFTNNKKVKGNLFCPVHTTYAGSASCPSACVWKGNGCFGENYPTQHTVKRVNVDAPSAYEIAVREAEGILRLPRYGALRIHTYGDCDSVEAAEAVSGAADQWVREGGRVSWSFTHNHDVPRKSWGGVSILRSCENPEQVKKAHTDGYAAAIVLTHFPSTKRFQSGGVSILPCPEQVDDMKPKTEQKGISCADCKLCWNDAFLLQTETAIGFIPHGTKQKAVRSLAYNPDSGMSTSISPIAMVKLEA